MIRLLFCAVFVLIRQLNCTDSQIDADRWNFCFTVREYTQIIGIVRVMEVAYFYVIIADFIKGVNGYGWVQDLGNWECHQPDR